MIYLDTAAALKLVHDEDESRELDAWLDERIRVPRVSSTLIEVEVPRALHRCAPEAMTRMPTMLSSVTRLEIDKTVRDTAAAFEKEHLRSLDAIHLATALPLAGHLEAFVTYDKRLLAAAHSQGLPTASPGA